MCNCATPTINGGLNGYLIDPPELAENEKLLFDEPGRCGRGIDSHSYHFRIVESAMHRFCLLVRHGAGDERFPLHDNTHALMDAIKGASDENRYWLLQCLYHTLSDTAKEAREEECRRWRNAAANKRIKTRKQPGRDMVRVWIEPPLPHPKN